MHPILTPRPAARPLRALAVAAALLLLPSTLGSFGTEAAERQKLRYQIEVGGVQVGTVELAAEAGRDTTKARVGWELGGLLGLIDREEGRLEARGRVGAGGSVLPAEFTGRFQESDREREVEIRYAPDGSIERLRLTRDGRRRNSDVPEALREDTVDTLTAFWRLRRWAAADGGNDEEPLELAVFDGRRRYDLHARRLGETRAELGGRKVPAERIELRLVPRAGFDDDGRVLGRKVDPDEPWAELVVTKGDDPIPLRATGTGRLPWEITLRRK